jgi:hypothetical protein
MTICDKVDVVLRIGAIATDMCFCRHYHMAERRSRRPTRELAAVRQTIHGLIDRRIALAGGDCLCLVRRFPSAMPWLFPACTGQAGTTQSGPRLANPPDICDAASDGHSGNLAFDSPAGLRSRQSGPRRRQGSRDR